MKASFLSMRCFFLAGILVGVLLSSETIRAEALPPQVKVVLAKISSGMEKKEYGKVAETLENAIAREETRHAELFFALGNCYLLQGRHPAAVKAYGQAVVLDPGHTGSWLNLAKTHYETKQYKEAGACFARGYDSDSGKNADNLYYSAAAYLMAGGYPEAIRSFDRLFGVHGKEIIPEWQEHYVHALLGGGQVKQALPFIRTLASQSAGAKKIQWQEILIHQYVSLNMQDEALAYARELTDLNPAEAKWWKALVHIQLEGNHYEHALAALIVYHYLTPLTPEEKKLLADLYLQIGIPDKAVPLYVDRLTSETDGYIIERLAMAYRQIGKTQSALEILSQYKKLDKDPRMLMLKGEICYGLKKYDAAADSYQRAARLQGKHQGQAWLMAGYSAMQRRDFVVSREALAQAARYDKEKSAANQALGYLNEGMVQ